MTKHIAPLPDPDGSLLLRELNHRVNNELTSTICTISAKAVESDDVAVKAALLDVVDLLHGYADVHKALRMPDRGHLTDAARYLQHLCFTITKYRLDRLSIRLLFSADDLRLEGERCWRLGLIVSELLTNVARHARFDDRHPEAKVKLLLAGSVVRCAVSDNGSASDLIMLRSRANDRGWVGQQFGWPRSCVLRRRRVFLPSHLRIDRTRATCRRRNSDPRISTLAIQHHSEQSFQLLGDRRGEFLEALERTCR
jgi:two-component sensor histidine kinase